MKVTDLKENECIHCETEEQAIAICKLMHDAGLTWRFGDSYLKTNEYSIYESETCYFPKEGEFCDLKYAKNENYTIYKAEQFLTKNIKVMSTIVNINPNTSEINITPKEGFEIDLEKSDLKNGKVILKEVESKYPSNFHYSYKRDGVAVSIWVSKKYADKLEILETLLCIRDEYNRIDGFEEGFRFREENWSIENFEGKLELYSSCYSNKTMHFGKRETAELFLKNFEEQLEQIKEFL